MIRLILSSIIVFVVFACGSKTEMKEDVSSEQTNVNSDSLVHQHQITGSEMHEVKVLEVLQADRYTYLKVSEKEEEFWIAALKLDNAAVGDTYLYQGGLLKTNFESQEHHRTFDKIYLVSEIINAKVHPGNNLMENSSTNHTHSNINIPSNKIADLISNSKKYENKEIVISGKIVKANYGIMNSNWYHIQDGTSVKGAKSDLVVTSKLEMQQGTQVQLKGKVVLNKDLGSGYFFKVMVEEAQLIN